MRVARLTRKEVNLPIETEEEGFEPPLPFGKPVFKTGAIGRSATLPLISINDEKLLPTSLPL